VKLYLSSYHLGTDTRLLTDLIGENKKIAIIPNALDAYTDIPRRVAGLQREKDDLEKIGLEPEELDLRNFFGKRDELKTKLSEYGAVWVLGGNTFVLRRAYKESGMDEWLRAQKENDGFVYAGYSAGGCVLQKELKSTEMVDEPYTVPEGYKPEVIWEGIGLIDFVFTPHFSSNHPESEATGREVEYLIKNKIEYRALRDGEALVIDAKSG
jgi:dipeptidase E